MQRKLNLNEPALRLLTLITVFLIVLPAALALLRALLDFSALGWLMIGSVLIGGALLIAFVMLIFVEQLQDNASFRVHEWHGPTKIRHADGRFECMYCGSQRVQAEDTRCPVCGSRISE